MNAFAIPCLSGVPAVLSWLRSHGVNSLCVDSREVAARARGGEQVAFVAWPGAARDGRAFVPDAVANGAVACLVEAEGLSEQAFTGAAVAAVPGLKATLAGLAHAFYGEPSGAIDVVAVTGTNGKTSTSWWTAQALSMLGMPCGVVGTLGVGQPGSGSFVPTGLTTPDPVTLHATLRQFADQGLRAAAIEASSIGIEERRLDATRIRVAQFTNFTQDHLDYHGSMDAYWQSKQALFDWPGLEAAVVNVDDPKGVVLARKLQGSAVALWTYSVASAASADNAGALAGEAALVPRLQAQGLTVGLSGMEMVVQERAATHGSDPSPRGVRDQVIDQAPLSAPLIGAFNAANLLAVVGALRALGVPLAQATAACAQLGAVPGRMQAVRVPGQAPLALPLAVVDYAHTPDALQQALLALRPTAQARGGALWCVFGCGGDRDPIKRPLMGKAADACADQVVLTSDNPRHERPQDILAQIRAGLARTQGVAVIEPRGEAIAHALTQARPSDVVLIAGKGHEATQDVAGVKTPFSDTDFAMNVLMQRRAA